MIRYTLACEAGHEFESWFPSSTAYDEQASAGLVSCPLCHSHRVGKTLMAPALARASEAVAVPAPVEAPPPAGGEDPHARMRAMLRAMHAHLRENADDVGQRFAGEARAMHDGSQPHRPIIGQASLADARDLLEDGVPICPLPPLPDERN